MRKILLITVALSFLLADSSLFATSTNDPNTELRTLVLKIRSDIQAGKKTESQLADDIHQFDVLLAEHKGEKTDAVAEILFMKATMYTDVFDDTAKAASVMKQLKTEFKGTSLVTEIEHQEAMLEPHKKPSDLVPGSQFPDFNVQDLKGQPISLTDYKGKVVLIDFWATWCPQCLADVPDVVAAYKKYHERGFDVIGISLDQNRKKLLNFIRKKDMVWPEYFDGQGRQNQLAVKYGVQATPTAYLLNTNGVIIAKGLRSSDLEKAVASALAQD